MKWSPTHRAAEEFLLTSFIIAFFQFVNLLIDNN